MIKAIYDAGLSQVARLVILVGLMAVELVIAYYIAKKMRLNGKRLVALYCGASIFGLIVAVFIGAMQLGKNPFTVQFITEELIYLPITMLHMFVPVIPVALIGAHLLKLDINKSMDIIGAVYMFYQGAGHISCAFFGCCHGYPSDFGIYNPLLGVTTFPVQFLDCLSCLAIFVCLMFYLKKHDYNANGYFFPIVLISYGVVRFLWEFARGNLKAVFNIFSYDQVHCVIMIAVGFAYLLFLNSYWKEKMARIEMRVKKRSKKGC